MCVEVAKEESLWVYMMVSRCVYVFMLVFRIWTYRTYMHVYIMFYLNKWAFPNTWYVCLYNGVFDTLHNYLWSEIFTLTLSRETYYTYTNDVSQRLCVKKKDSYFINCLLQNYSRGSDTEFNYSEFRVILRGYINSMWKLWCEVKFMCSVLNLKVK